MIICFIALLVSLESRINDSTSSKDQGESQNIKKTPKEKNIDKGVSEKDEQKITKTITQTIPKKSSIKSPDPKLTNKERNKTNDQKQISQLQKDIAELKLKVDSKDSIQVRKSIVSKEMAFHHPTDPILKGNP